MLRGFQTTQQGLTCAGSVDDAAFAAGADATQADLLDDDLPINADYLARPKARRPRDNTNVVSNIDGETIRILDPAGLRIIDDYLVPDRYHSRRRRTSDVSATRIVVQRARLSLRLFEGYDWEATRSSILSDIRAVKRKLHKIRQVMAEGQTPDETVEEASAPLFASIHLGLGSKAHERDVAELLETLEQELPTDEGANSDEWQAFPRTTLAQLVAPPLPRAQQKLVRSGAHAIAFDLHDLDLTFDQFPPDAAQLSRLTIRADRFEIVDNMRSSTWLKFLSELRVGDGGVARPTGAPMLRVELAFAPSPAHGSEASLKVRSRVRRSD